MNNSAPIQQPQIVHNDKDMKSKTKMRRGNPSSHKIVQFVQHCLIHQNNNRPTKFHFWYSRRACECQYLKISL